MGVNIERPLENATRESLRRQYAQLSYRTALSAYRARNRWLRIPWATWILTLGTTLFWCFTAYQAGLRAGAKSVQAVISNIVSNAIDVQPASEDALTSILIRYGAKENSLISHGQYWRFITPIFLHVNLLHVGLNMLNLLMLGIFLERLLGSARFVLIYLITGVVSVIASFYFAPDVVSVGASGAVFGLVGAYSIFVLVHRRAFRNGGLFALLWLVFIIGINLGIGLVIPNVDNSAHVGGLLSGCLLGWFFAPVYRQNAAERLVDTHRLAQRWPLAVLTVSGTLLLAIIAVYLYGTRS
jgi:rhomboid protease GluP